MGSGTEQTQITVRISTMGVWDWMGASFSKIQLGINKVLVHEWRAICSAGVITSQTFCNLCRETSFSSRVAKLKSNE